MADQKSSAVAVAPQPGAFVPQTINLGQYPKEKYNLLVRGTSLVQTNPFLRPLLREISLDPDPAGGDVYPLTTRKQGNAWVNTELGISAVGLANLASNAGILDVPQASGRVDNGSDPRVCTYRSTGAMRMPDGEWRVVTRECTVKLATLEKEITTQKTAKAEQYEWNAGKLAAEIAKELLLKEKFLERLAETGAKNRVTRVLLGLKGKYTPAELAKPFVFAAVVPDYNQPELRARMLDQAAGATGMVFGPGSGGAAAVAPRMLSAGPAEADVARGDFEAATELDPEELGGAGAFSDPQAQTSAATADDDGSGDPAWAKDPFAASAKPAAAETETPLEQLIRVLRKKAADSKILGPISDVQKPLVMKAVGGDVQLLAAGLHATWNLERDATGLLPVTGAQAQAIINASVDDDFQRLWREAFGQADAS